MDRNRYLILEEDLKIKNILVGNGIINNSRIAMCGKWFNKKHKKNKTRFFCMNWECRMCRRKLIEKINTTHSSHNQKFLNKGGTLLLLTLTVPNFTYHKKNNIFTKFKNSLSLLKESRGWDKIKDLTNIYMRSWELE